MESAVYYKQPSTSRRIKESRSNNGKKKEHDEMRSNHVHAVASHPWRPDNKDGHYVFEVGENITSRYRIISKLGEGTFGRVLDCWDGEKQEHVAIKVIRSEWQYGVAAMTEIDILRRIAEFDTNGSRGCLKLKTWFHFGAHVCIVCEKLGPSLYDLLRRNNHRPLSVVLIREFARQLLEAVAFIHELTLSHTDLKPDNILLVSSEYDKNSSDRKNRYKCIPSSSAIKLIDFGNATFQNQYHRKVVTTRGYRAPEVVMGVGWSYPIDLWSVGCVLAELFCGNALFQTDDDLEHLAMMQRVLGPIPQHMIKWAADCGREYIRNGRELNWPRGAASRDRVRLVQRLPRLRNLVNQNGDPSSEALIDLLRGLLKFDPRERLSANEALNHHFFKLK